MAHQSRSAAAFRIYQQAIKVTRKVFLRQRANPGPEHVLLAMRTINHELTTALIRNFGIDGYKFERAIETVTG